MQYLSDFVHTSSITAVLPPGAASSNFSLALVLQVE